MIDDQPSPIYYDLSGWPKHMAALVNRYVNSGRRVVEATSDYIVMEGEWDIPNYFFRYSWPRRLVATLRWGRRTSENENAQLPYSLSTEVKDKVCAVGWSDSEIYDLLSSMRPDDKVGVVTKHFIEWYRRETGLSKIMKDELVRGQNSRKLKRTALVYLLIGICLVVLGVLNHGAWWVVLFGIITMVYSIPLWRDSFRTKVIEDHTTGIAPWV